METLPPMRWVWWEKPATLEEIKSQVGFGWHQILTDLVQDLFKYGWNGELLQVKEKFGTLDFYINDLMVGSELFHLINNASSLSSITCEKCGQPGVRIPGGFSGFWIKTCCETHASWWKNKKGNEEEIWND